MTDTNQTPEPTAAETPTAPLPTAPEPAPAYNTAPPAAAPPFGAEPPLHHHGMHVPHRVSEGAIAAMVIGTLLLAVLAFGIGWAARGAATRFQDQRAGIAGQGYGQSFGNIPGHQGLGRGMMRGQGYGRGNGGQGYGYGQGGTGQQGQGFGGQGNGSTTPTATPY
jgi:hypothetical protein